MSVSYWGIVGYGVLIDDIMPFIDNELVNVEVRERNKDIEFKEDVFDDDTFYGDPYTNFGEFLCELDKTNTLTWDDAGNCERTYLLYEPQYPWHLKDNEPESYEDIEERIYNVIKQVGKVTQEEIHKLCYNISDAGCG